MKVSINIQAGICGFETTVIACGSEVKEPAGIEIKSNCEKILALGESVREVRGLDELTMGFDGVIMSEARKILKGCCAGCVVPAAVFKAMQVASGLALPKDILISMTKE